MGQVLSAISGNETTPQKKQSSPLSSRQYKYSQYNANKELPKPKTESTISTSRSMYYTNRELPQLKTESTPQSMYYINKELPRMKTESTISTPRSTQRSYNIGDFESLEKLYQARQQEVLKLYKIRQQEAINLRKARQQEKVSQVTTSLPNRAVTISERKVTSGVKENTSSLNRLSVTSEKKIASRVKDNTTSLSHLPSVEKKKPTAFGTKGNLTSPFDYPYNISSTSEDNTNTTSLNRDDLENIKRVTQIIRAILSRDINYVIYGNWSCPHWPNSCDSEEEWQCKYTRETLKRYLMLNSENKHNFFMKSCKGCNKKSTVSSFFLYKQQPIYTHKEPTIEIICRLVWKDHYRVFAEWKCQRPQLPRHEWKSSYTWISLRNFIEKTPVKDLKEGNYYVQKCHECREECKVCKNKPKEKRGCKKCDHDTVVLGYSQLVQSSGGKPHKRWLCAKCKEGSICRSDNNYRVPRKRHIELF